MYLSLDDYRRDALRVIMESATKPETHKTIIQLAYISLNNNNGISSPVASYFRTLTAESISDTLIEDSINKDQIAFSDQLLYHFFLYSLNYVFPSEISTNILSSPRAMRVIVQSFFPRIKKESSDVLKAFMLQMLEKFYLETGKQKLKKFVKEEFANYLKKQIMGSRGSGESKVTECLINFIKENIQNDSEEILKKLEVSFEDLVDRRKDLALDILNDVHSITKNVFYSAAENGLTMNHVIEIIDVIEINQKRTTQLIAIPKFSSNDQNANLSLTTKVSTAWAMTSFTNPILGPLWFTSSSPNITEIGIRLAGVMIANYSENYCVSIAITELAVTIVPKTLEKNKRLEFISEPIRKTFKIGRETILDSKRDLIRKVRSSGMTNTQIRLLSKSTAQFSGGMLYFAFMSSNNAFSDAMNAGYFLDYYGKIGENLGLIDQKSVESQSGIDGIPYKIITGLALGSLGTLFGPSSGTCSSLAILMTTPVVADTIVSHQFYKKSISQPMRKLLIPYYSRLIVIGQGLKITSFLNKFGTTFSIPYVTTPIVWIKNGVIGAGATAACAALTSKSVREKSAYVGSEALSCYSRYSFAATVNDHLGPEIATVTYALLLPKDLTSVTVVSMGILAGSCSESPSLVFATMEMTNQVLRSPTVISTMQTKFAKFATIGQKIHRIAKAIHLAYGLAGQEMLD